MKYVCDVCGWEYDEENGYPEGGIAPGTKWEDIPDDFECPLCFVGIELDFHVRHLFLYRGFIIPHGKAFFCDEVTLRKFLYKPKRAVKQYVRYRFTALSHLYKNLP